VNRPFLIVALLVGVVLVGAYVTYVMIWAETEPPLPPLTKVEPEEGSITIVKAEGLVERSRGDSDWVAVRPGQRIALKERLRTNEAGRAELDIGDGSTVVVADRSEVVFSGKSKNETRLRLHRGRVSAKKRRRGKSVLKIEAPETDAAVTSEEGSFTVTTDGLGTLAVATTVGNAKLGKAGKETVITAGQQSIAFADGSVSDTAEIPKSLLLKVGKLPKGVRRKRSIVIRGRSEPGAIVMVNGVRAKVDRRGRFRAKVALREGDNPVSVTAEGIAGINEELSLEPIQVDSRAPKSTVDAAWE